MLSTKILFLRFIFFVLLRKSCGFANVPSFNKFFQFFKFIPLELNNIFLELEIAITLILIFKLLFKYSSCEFSWFNNSLPTFPTPVMKRLTSLTFFSKNFSCKVFNAFLIFFLSITALIFLSEAP